MTAPRNRRRGDPTRLGPISEPALPWVTTACACLLVAALSPAWWAAGAVLVGLVAVVMLGVLASERTAPVRPLEAPADPSESIVRDRRTGHVVEGPWS